MPDNDKAVSRDLRRFRSDIRITCITVDFGIWQTSPWLSDPPNMGHTGYSKMQVTFEGSNQAIYELDELLRSIMQVETD